MATVKKPKKPATDQLKLVPCKYMIDADGEGFGMWVIPRSSIPRLLDLVLPKEAMVHAALFVQALVKPCRYKPPVELDRDHWNV